MWHGKFDRLWNKFRNRICVKCTRVHAKVFERQFSFYPDLNMPKSWPTNHINGSQRPKTTYTDSAKTYTQRKYCTRTSGTYTHTLELVEKFLLNGFQAYFGALYFILGCVASWLNLLYQPSKWLGETSAMPQPLVKRIPFRNKFSGWKRRKKRILK